MERKSLPNDKQSTVKKLWNNYGDATMKRIKVYETDNFYLNM